MSTNKKPHAKASVVRQQGDIVNKQHRGALGHSGALGVAWGSAATSALSHGFSVISKQLGVGRHELWQERTQKPDS